MKLNLINREKSDIGYSIFRFPDGEVQMILGEFSRKEVVDIECRITNAEELFVLMQTCDILNRHGVMFSISIYYLMSMRMDRVMDFSRPYTLKIVVGILDNLGAFSISVFCPHSEMSLDLFKMTPVTLIRPNTLVYYGANHFRSYQMILPDTGAVKRYRSNGDVPNNIIIGEKVRDVDTGKIVSIKIKNPEALTGEPLLIQDDLCDRGGTFMGLAEAVKEINPEADINIFVCHMVNPKGIKNLSETFNHVWFTNSYKDWKSHCDQFPDNVTQIDIV